MSLPGVPLVRPSEYRLGELVDSWAGKVVAVLKAYVDESGTHEGSPVLTVACYFAELEQWTQFESRWREFLDAEKLPYFRMADCEFGYGPFKGQTEEQKIRRLQSAHRIIGETTIAGIAISVGTADYQQAIVNSPIAQSLTSPYVFCLFGCLQRLAFWARENDYADKIACVIEKGSGQGQHIDALERAIRRNQALWTWFHYARWVLADKRTVLPLQAADVLAYESGKHWINFFTSQRPTRKSLQSLLKHGNFHHEVFGHYYDQARLERFVRIWTADSESAVGEIITESDL